MPDQPHLPWAMRLKAFLIKHPHLKEYVPEFLSAYRKHLAQEVATVIDLDTAYAHVFDEKCRLCLNDFEAGKRRYDQFLM